MLVFPLSHSINFFLNGVMEKPQLRSCMKSVTQFSGKDKLNLYLHPNFHKKFIKKEMGKRREKLQ